MLLLPCPQAELVRDPHFLALMQRSHPGLPAAAAAALHLEAGPGAARRMLASHPVAGGAADPLAAVLAGLQRGVAAMAQHFALGFVKIGNMLRGLAAEIGDVLKAMGRPAAGGGAEGAGGPVAADRAIDRAVVKIAIAVLVVVVLK